MTDAIDKLKQPPPPMMVPGCSTCRHLQRDGSLSRDAYWWRCGVVGGHYTRDIYHTRCKGDLWEPKPPPVPVLVRFKRWLVG